MAGVHRPLYGTRASVEPRQAGSTQVIHSSFNSISHQTGSTSHDRSTRDFRLQNILQRRQALFHLCILYAHCSMEPSRPVTLPSKPHTYTDSFSCTGVLDVMDSRHRKRQSLGYSIYTLVVNPPGSVPGYNRLCSAITRVSWNRIRGIGSCGDSSVRPAHSEQQVLRALHDHHQRKRERIAPGFLDSSPAGPGPSQINMTDASYLTEAPAALSPASHHTMSTPSTTSSTTSPTPPSTTSSTVPFTTTPTASPHALQIVEVLEQILVSLPARDLLLAQRVSQHWRATITTSPHLQRALFLKPAALAAAKPGALAPEDVRTNPLLAGPCARYGSVSSRILPAPDGLFMELCLLQSRGAGAGAPAGSGDAPYRRAEASWRRMYLTQPPVTTVFVVDDFSLLGLGFDGHHAFMAQEETGLLMEQVIYHH